ncbi:hypothetical protein GPECTOR_2g1131 [Gonium pectorale]|uniref:Uncharacterized protein n=1 Tax=Gonium pectorale TaxID=33097 RepID=A0A150H0S1_GONPE|nr:hypothetical protein GPECTOR_2g1131 [Gonium pectorale]|eukprot:KXZ55582.1 hypothetical protein GPECTOR_2g1131 [Gonium pectorale]
MSVPDVPPGPGPSPSPPPVPDAAGGTIPLSPIAVALSAAVLVVNAFISLRFKLGLHVQLVVASVRMVVQLSILGYVLVPIFSYDRWWLVLLYALFMLMIASLEAVQRPGHTFQGMLANTALAMASSSGLLLTYVVLVVLALRPVWDAQYTIPLLGMLLGNATSAVSVGLSTLLEDLAANKAVVEHLLALGANRYEATDAAVRRALKAGMMTGQILAGGDPAQAARYQMVIMFVIGAATCLASVISVYLAVLHLMDATHTFRPDRLLRRQQAGAGAFDRAAWLAAVRRGWATERLMSADSATSSLLTAGLDGGVVSPTSPRLLSAEALVFGREQAAGSVHTEGFGEDELPVSSGAGGGLTAVAEEGPAAAAQPLLGQVQASSSGAGGTLRAPFSSATQQQHFVADTAGRQLPRLGSIAGASHGPTATSGVSSAVSWSAICSEARAEAERKRGVHVVIDDYDPLKQWLIKDIHQRAKAKQAAAAEARKKAAAAGVGSHHDRAGAAEGEGAGAVTGAAIPR